MDIRITSTGKIWRRIDDGVGLMLIDALPSIFERVKPQVQPTAAPITVPTYAFDHSPYTGAPMVVLHLPSGERRQYFANGTKEAAELALGGGNIPDHVWAEFDAKRKAHFQGSQR